METDSFEFKIDNNVLLISEKEQKAFLPYKYFDLEEIYKTSEGKFSSVSDIKKQLYELPLTRFTNSSFSRFREAFNLVRYKQKGSIIEALDLGVELMFNFSLNPIIISACRNIDELDIYLDCLEQNELDKFDCFDIKFEMAPDIVSFSKKINI